VFDCVGFFRFKERVMSSVTSDEALSLLRRVASGETVPERKDASQHWGNSTMDLTVDGWTVGIFTDEGRRNRLDTITSPDGRRGEFKDWRSNALFSQQPEDRLHREDNKSLNRMFLAFKRAQ
jgi:hypothetical protein